MGKNKTLTLGSLFDGSGGFPLGGLLCGIRPVWASEVEPFPIRVTTRRLPFMKHLGDISKVNGAEIEPVDIITFGSPCQDMSLAGKRAGLDGSRSGLFYEAVRIVKEMRRKTNGKYPRYIVWENVTGAFSSNGGKDFRAVLEEIAGIAEEVPQVPMPEKGGWPYADVLVGRGWSIAYRTFDAQYWGVPQRRRRIYLVADFAGEDAKEILFEPKGMPWDTEPCEEQGKETAAGSGRSVKGSGRSRCEGLVLNDQGGQRMDVTNEMTGTLRASSNHPPLVFENHSQDSRYTGPLTKSQTVSATFGLGGNNQPFVLEPKTLKMRSGCAGGGKGPLVQDNRSATLGCVNDQTVFVPVAFGISSKDSNGMKSANPASGIYKASTSRTIDVNGSNPACNQGGIAVVEHVETYDVRQTSEGTINTRTHAYKTDTSRCVDRTGNVPGTNHGGVAVVSLQGSMIGRKEKNGPQGDGINENVSFTLNTVDRHAVVYALDRVATDGGMKFKGRMGITNDGVNPTITANGPGAVGISTYSMTTGNFIQANKEKSPTIAARDYKDAPIVNTGRYMVRRLTPTECARLQGFPDGWCEGLETDEPSMEELRFWYKVFADYAKVTGKKTKSLKAISAWLRHPHSDSAEYKMWGNGVALPCVRFVLGSIQYLSQK